MNRESQAHVEQELTVVVPTYNEVENILPLVDSLTKVLDGRQWEVLFVDDDSPDGTSKIIYEIAERNHRVKLIHRMGRRGLSSACIEGMQASSSPYIAVMDADLQHDESLLPKILDTLEGGDTDLVVGSRNLAAGSFGEMKTIRRWLSKLATMVTKLALRVPLSDPMSGYFMLTRELFEKVENKVTGQGFKILLDICVNAPTDIRVKDLPYTMRDRRAGASKLSLLVVFEFISFVVHKYFGRILPLKMVKFFLVGGVGVVVHIVILALTYRMLEVSFTGAQFIATYTAMLSNYVLNNNYTFIEAKLSRAQWWYGLFKFIIVCSVGGLIGIAVGDFLYELSVHWIIAGLATTLIAALWNYSVNSIFTWRTN